MSNTIYIDFHGVLTDGKLNMAQDGQTLFESMSHRDTAAMRELVARGYEVHIVTSSNGPIIKSYAEKVGCGVMVLRDKSQVSAKDFIAIGDSVLDIPMFEFATACYCPADADERVQQFRNMQVLKTKGGNGCIAELVKILTRENTPKMKWEPIDTSTTIKHR